VERKDLLGASLEKHTAEFFLAELDELGQSHGDRTSGPPATTGVLFYGAYHRTLSVTRARAGSAHHQPYVTETPPDYERSYSTTLAKRCSSPAGRISLTTPS